jgi:hypothetical protein
MIVTQFYRQQTEVQQYLRNEIVRNIGQKIERIKLGRGGHAEA